jgi:hypothetical protein
MAIKRPIFSITRPSKIYPNWEVWYENITSGNLDNQHYHHFQQIITRTPRIILPIGLAVDPNLSVPRPLEARARRRQGMAVHSETKILNSFFCQFFKHGHQKHKRRRIHTLWGAAVAQW